MSVYGNDDFNPSEPVEPVEPVDPVDPSGPTIPGCYADSRVDGRVFEVSAILDASNMTTEVGERFFFLFYAGRRRDW